MRLAWPSILIAACLVGLTLVVDAQAAPAPAPEPNSDVAVCAAAVPAHFARCLARVRTDAKVVGKIPARDGVQSPNVVGNGGAYDPAYLQSAYNLASIASSAGRGRTVAIVDAFDAPNAESDLATYRNQWGLPPCTSASGCFRKLNQAGGQGPYPRADAGWAQEISLDLDMVSAICPLCNIMLVEANTNSLRDLGTSVNTAANQGAFAISNSYGGPEYAGEDIDEATFYNHNGIAVTVSSGDNGYGVEFPAASQYVTAVGGTTLNQQTNSGTRSATETVWSGAGSGCSAFISKPSWQKDTGCGRRTVADVSAVANPNTGVWVYDGAWLIFGGTSVSSPIIASVYALAGGNSIRYAADVYANPGSLFDIVVGSNGTCNPNAYLCNGGPGYDGPTGLGSPNGTTSFTGAGAVAPTSTPTPTSISTSTPTATMTSTATPTITNTPTATSVATATLTATPRATGAAATFVSQDNTTEGSWKGVYGSQGYWLEADGQNLPTYAQLSVGGTQAWTWAGSTADVRALQKAASPTDRLAATVFDGVQFTVDLNLTDGQPHRVSIYSLDWDSTARGQTVAVVDASTGSVLDSRSLSSFQGGSYLTWTLTGHVQLRFSRTAGANAVLSALLFDAPGGGTPATATPTPTTTPTPTATTTPSPVTPTATPRAGAAATFVSQDNTTEGSWKGVYGSQGYWLEADGQNLPTYAQLSVGGTQAWTWADSTADARALQKAASPTDRLAATVFDGVQFTVDLNLTDGQPHRVSIYSLDWDSTARGQTVAVVDASTGSILDSRGLSNFHAGSYLTWTLTGHVQLRFSRTAGANAVLSAMFFF